MGKTMKSATSSSASLPRWRRQCGFLVWFSTFVLLSACVVVPDFESGQTAISLADTSLATLENGEVIIHQIQVCVDRADSTASTLSQIPQVCGYPTSHLLLRPKGWNLLDETISRLDQQPSQSRVFIGPDSMDISNYIAFTRPPAASRNARSRWVGFFEGGPMIETASLVWMSEPEGAEAARYERVQLPRKGRSPPLVPALVVRDGNEVWMFAERSGADCDSDLCFPIAETLGIDPADLPASLRRNFMLFHADVTKRAPMLRAFGANFSRYLNRPVTPLPVPAAAKFSIDFNAVARVKSRFFEGEVLCRTAYTSVASKAFLLIPPVGALDSADRKYFYTFQGCTRPDMAGHVLAPPEKKGIPDPVQASSVPEPSDTLIRPQTSSYYCHKVPLPKQAQHGRGTEGCYFILHEPGSGRVLPQTPYFIGLGETGTNARTEFKGVTDDFGRTEFIRSESPMSLSRLRVVRRVAWSDGAGVSASSVQQGSGEYKAVQGKRYTDRFTLEALPHQRYRVSACTGDFYTGLTDELGWTAFFESALPKDCEFRYSS